MKKITLILINHEETRGKKIRIRNNNVRRMDGIKGAATLYTWYNSSFAKFYSNHS
jgi:hypothetical protein